jgi:hypothetical protein
MTRLPILCATLFGFAIPFAGMAAEKACTTQPDIVALSNFVLANREHLPKLLQKRHGAIAAYLSLQYKPESADKARALLDTLVEQKVMRADELALAWAIHKDGPEKALQQRDAASTKAILINRAGVSALRMLVLADNREPLFAMLATISDAERVGVESALVIAVLDQPDAVKSELASESEKRGLMGLAGGFAVTQKDPNAWTRFIEHIKEPAEITYLVQRWHWAPAYVGHASMPQSEAEGESETNRRSRINLNLVMQAGAVMPERDFLLTYVNRTFDIDGASAASEAILAEASRHGDANPWSMDQAWLLTYRSLHKAAADKQTVEASLGATKFDESRSDSGSVRDKLDWMLAVEKLTPYVNGQSANRGIPQEATRDFTTNWPRWREIADAVRNGDDLSRFKSDPETTQIVTELLFSAAKPGEVVSFLVTSGPDVRNIALAEDFAARMDRNCDGYLNTAAEALLLPGSPIFKF